MGELEMVADALRKRDISVNDALDLIESQFECVMIIGVPEIKAFQAPVYPRMMVLTNEYIGHGHHVDMHKLSKEQIINLCEKKQIKPMEIC